MNEKILAVSFEFEPEFGAKCFDDQSVGLSAKHSSVFLISE